MITFIATSIFGSSTPSLNFTSTLATSWATSLERAFIARVAGDTRVKKRSVRGGNARGEGDLA